MTRPEPTLPPPDEGSLSSRRSYPILSELSDLLASKEARRSVFFYAFGLFLMVLGGLYAIWRISLLTQFQADAWAYMKARDERWDKYMDVQTKNTREILRRLPP
jgi:hypothetical protein